MNLKWMRIFRKMRLGFLLLAMLGGFSTPAFSYDQHARYATHIQEIPFSALPVEAQRTLLLIKQNGPYPYPRDGIVFGNYEKLLPVKQRGYYHEYTVKTPGVRSRGARRIVCGQVKECYYSNDHYKTFNIIKE